MAGLGARTAILFVFQNIVVLAANLIAEINGEIATLVIVVALQAD